MSFAHSCCKLIAIKYRELDKWTANRDYDKNSTLDFVIDILATLRTADQRRPKDYQADQ